MSTMARPTPGGEAPVAPDGNGTPVPQQDAIKSAADAARALVKERGVTTANVTASPDVPPIRLPARDAASAAPGTAQGDLGSAAAGAVAPIAGDGAAADDAAQALDALDAVVAGDDGADGAPADAELTVQVPGREEGETIPIVVSDRDTAERLNQLVRGFARGEQARAIREDAQRDREEAEEFRYLIQADPIGVVTDTVRSPVAMEHMAKYLLTRPGMRDKMESFLLKILDDPSTVETEARLVEADRITYRDQVQGQVNHERAVNKNARQVMQRIYHEVERVAPSAWSDESQRQFVEDVTEDVKKYARARNAEQVDPRQVPALVQRRLQLIGVAPRAVAPASTGQGPTGTKGPVVPAGKTAEQLQADRQARRASASAPTGAGSPTPSPLKVPAYDPKAKGSPIAQAAAAARAAIKVFRASPS